MKVIRAEAMGMCFGVRNALACTERIEHPEAVAIHGELVHNEEVLTQLNERGFQMTSESDRRCVPLRPEILITAHGISDAERDRLQAAGQRLIDMTCPLVRRVHRAARSLADAGFHVLIVGRQGHVEVQGIVEDLDSYDVLESPAQVQRYSHSRLGVVCQTTASPRLAERICAAIRDRHPGAEIRFVNTICQPTLQRQQAVERLLRHVDALVVVGGRNSNNTRQLAARSREQGVPALHVQTAADLDPAWFGRLGRCRVVGLTAGASTPDATIQQVHESLCRLDVPDDPSTESSGFPCEAVTESL